MWGGALCGRSAHAHVDAKRHQLGIHQRQWVVVEAYTPRRDSTQSAAHRRDTQRSPRICRRNKGAADKQPCDTGATALEVSLPTPQNSARKAPGQDFLPQQADLVLVDIIRPRLLLPPDELQGPVVAQLGLGGAVLQDLNLRLVGQAGRREALQVRIPAYESNVYMCVIRVEGENRLE